MGRSQKCQKKKSFNSGQQVGISLKLLMRLSIGPIVSLQIYNIRCKDSGRIWLKC